MVAHGLSGTGCWFAERCGDLISVEHDPVWAKRVERWLDERGLRQRVALRLYRRTTGGTPAAYVAALESQPDSSLDFILVDGKLRDACALASLEKLRPGGLLIVDDVHRYIPRENASRAPHARRLDDGFASQLWEAFADAIDGWQVIWRTDGISDAAVWIRPCLQAARGRPNGASARTGGDSRESRR